MSLNRVNEQKFLLGAQYEFPIGVDEAGRGPLAGPVTCGAVFIPADINIGSLGLVADSKVMSESDRERTFEIVSHNPKILWDVSVVSHNEIDEMNILQASLTGMRRATESVLQKMSTKSYAKETGLKFVNEKCIGLVDGNKIPSNMPIYSVFVIKGDSYIYSIAIASILAKVTRDRIMKRYHLEYPQYNFAQHKGYPTFHHRTILHEIGPCPIHRITYGPVKLAIIAAQERKRKVINKSNGAEEGDSVKVSCSPVDLTSANKSKKRRKELTINEQPSSSSILTIPTVKNMKAMKSLESIKASAQVAKNIRVL